MGHEIGVLLGTHTSTLLGIGAWCAERSREMRELVYPDFILFLQVGTSWRGGSHGTRAIKDMT